MEIFLNLLWVAIALALLSWWRFSWAVQPREYKHAAWRQWAAVVCALIFLFFMVSLTDDLHSDLMIFEECSAGRRHVACLHGSHHLPPQHARGPVSAILGSSNSIRVMFLLGPVVPERRAASSDFAPSLNSGRAPPVMSL
jgi:hypothetical protein